MQTSEALIIVFLILLTGYFLLNISVDLMQLIMKKQITFSAIFRNFSQKLWMTAGLGIIFFTLYFLLIAAFSFFNETSIRLAVFNFIYANPITAIYCGLCVFIVVSIGIYAARRLIISIYNRRRH